MTYVAVQPVMMVPLVPTMPAGPPRSPEWRTGLFDCFDDVNECCDTMWCHYCKLGKMSHAIERGQIGFDCPVCCGACCGDACTGLGTFVATLCMRSRVVSRYGIDENGCVSCLLAFFCTGCAICQQAREMELRGEPCGGIMCKSAVYHPQSIVNPGAAPPVAGMYQQQQQQQPQYQQQPVQGQPLQTNPLPQQYQSPQAQPVQGAYPGQQYQSPQQQQGAYPGQQYPPQQQQQQQYPPQHQHQQQQQQGAYPGQQDNFYPTKPGQ